MQYINKIILIFLHNSKKGIDEFDFYSPLETSFSIVSFNANVLLKLHVLSNTSRIFLQISFMVKGFWINGTPSSRNPRCVIALFE